MGEEYGPLVRLWGIHPSQLPVSGAKGDDLKPLLTSILKEALPFISGVRAHSSDTLSLWKPKSTKSFPNSTSQVQLYERTVLAEQLRAVFEKHHPPGVDAKLIRSETWALRQSVHDDAATRGTACWTEFVRCFKERHAEAEVIFTPNIISTTRRQEWDCAGVEVEAEAGGATWVDWTLCSEESLHELPKPLRRRVFPVVQATATLRGRREFLVVQIAAQAADEDTKSGTAGDGEALRASYTSVELVRDTANGKIEWIMGTASNAGGALPAWIQKMSVPGQIAKDVDMFLSLNPPTKNATLLNQADALASMTFELSLRAIGGLAERLEREVRKLVLRTEQDTEFRHNNEKRLTDIMREIQSVKMHMAAATAGQVDLEGSFERQQKETAKVMDGFRKEVLDLKGLMDSVSSQLDQFPSLDDINKDIVVPHTSSRVMETRAMRRASRQVAMQPPKQQTAANTKYRIQEAINSTRRWNRDHKVTPLSDSQFVVNYLKKQSQRDPGMAVLLQRSLQKRIRLRAALTSGKTLTKPRSLEELCRDAVWQDVIDMVRDVLVVNGHRSATLLGRGKGL
ncbi:hypothetical protein EDB81DRAFT_865048 [Dactylonectria macrodidyma]|uniref:DUF3074 domain-containing protein n=1 Tax=Dactylonectria macrodidyma TaxID=307937 RepID=A0A9P9JLN1_9HYPO|nr:hypothetical protein EDB81DRAFT_865048 [Dactylonectria macrodidyma]